MRIALIGDVHLYSLSVHPKRLLGKRALAHTNLLMNRRRRFNHALMPALVKEVGSLSPEMVLFSGDVTTSSLESEFEDFVELVQPLVDVDAPGGGVPAVLVPGNHDRYTFRSRRKKRIETLLERVMPSEFPHTRPLKPGRDGGGWRLLALDSAVPNRFFSRGALGSAQYASALEQIAKVKEGEGLLVLCHYPVAVPPRVPTAWSHDLKEDKGLREALAACRGRVVYLHGHIHKPWHAVPPGDATAESRPPFECLNAGSPCFTSTQYPLGQGFWMIDLPEDTAAPLGLEHWVPRANGHSVAASGDVEWFNDHEVN